MTTERISAVDVPLVVDPEVSVTDPVLTRFLQFFQAVANAYGTEAWQTVQPGPGSVPVKRIFEHDPNELAFDDKDLPALFLWRGEQTKRVDVTIDQPVYYGQLNLLWVPPRMAEPGRRKLRNPFVNGIMKLLDVYFERQRDPAWYVNGDDYPRNTGVLATDRANCAAYGSVLSHWAPFRRAWMDSWKRVPVTISYDQGTPPSTYGAYLCVIHIEEELVRDPNRFDPNQGLDQKINVPADDTFPAYTIVEGEAT